MGIGDSAARQRFPADADAVWAATVRACSRLGKVSQRDDYLHRLVLVTGMSGFSWGERVTVQVAPLDAASAEVSIESSLRLGVNVAGAGRNRKNVDELVAAVSYELQRGAPNGDAADAIPSHGRSADDGIATALRILLGAAIVGLVLYLVATRA